MGQRLSRFGRIMVAKGIRAEDMAREAGLSLGYVYKIRRGDQVPSIRAARKLARLVGEPISVFDDEIEDAADRADAV